MLPVQRAVVISMAWRIDRLDAFYADLPPNWPWPVPQTYPAVDGYTMPLPKPWWGPGPGAFGCSLSHQDVLRQALDDGVEHLLVLEDDAVFTDDFDAVLDRFTTQLPADWQMLMLGGQHRGPAPHYRLDVVRCTRTERTHAYIVRRQAMRLLLSTWSMHVGHIDTVLHQIQMFLPTYAPVTWLAGQRSGLSDISRSIVPQHFWDDTI